MGELAVSAFPPTSIRNITFLTSTANAFALWGKCGSPLLLFYLNPAPQAQSSQQEWKISEIIPQPDACSSIFFILRAYFIRSRSADSQLVSHLIMIHGQVCLCAPSRFNCVLDGCHPLSPNIGFPILNWALTGKIFSV